MKTLDEPPIFFCVVGNIAKAFSEHNLDPSGMAKKVKIYLLLFAGIFPVSAEAWAQPKTLEEDVVYLRNGSILRGKITEQIPGESVTIVTFDGSEFQLNTSEVDKIVREPSQYTRIKVRYNGDVVPIVYDASRGFYKGYSIGLAVNESNGSFTVQTRGGYKWRHWLHTGLVSGLDPYNAGLIIPVAAEVRGDLFQKAVTPFYFVQGGYGITATQSLSHRVYNGGGLFHAGVGLTFKTRTSVDYQLSVGYKWQGTYQEFEERPPFFWTPDNQIPPDPVLVTGNRNYRRITIMFSTSF